MSDIPPCPTCGGERAHKYGQRFCRACHLRRMAIRRRRGLSRYGYAFHGAPLPPPVGGAKESLRRYLDSLSTDALMIALARLLQQRKAAI